MSSTATSSPNAAALLAPIAEDMQHVNRVIRQRLASEVMLINQISEYIIGAGGKRLRPALLLLVSGALGDTTGHRHELAAVVEFIHTATLLHDDVVDESDLRRGQGLESLQGGTERRGLPAEFRSPGASRRLSGAAGSCQGPGQCAMHPPRIPRG